MNPDLERLQPYPFERLRALLDGCAPTPGLEPIALSMGEPRHAAPAHVLEALEDVRASLGRYPATRGEARLRECIAAWLVRRFGLRNVAPERQVLPVNGTREALFAIAQAVVARGSNPLVAMPNPFYQIYEGAALLAGAEPYYLNCSARTDFLPELEAVPPAVWRRTQLLYLCTPGNPSGAVLPLSVLQRAMDLALEYDFLLVSDECYSELYHRENAPPPGLLEACAAAGNDDYSHCLAFHSLSKRSNLPGLRSGFVAGDAGVLQRFLTYRTYHGCAMPLHHQIASIAAWSDESHVIENRRRYREKFRKAREILGPVLHVTIPEAGFYLWPDIGGDDADFARSLYQEQAVTVLPGSFLGREAGGSNPGASRLRLALVAEPAQCTEALERVALFLSRG